MYDMQRYKTRYILALAALLAACGKIDNYPGPDASIHGAVMEAGSKAPIQTQIPNGIRIRLLETKYKQPLPLDFWVKEDGTFSCSALFAGHYKVVPVEGAFFPADTLELELSGNTEVNFTVTPFLTISASAKPVQGGVAVEYRIGRSQVETKIAEARVMASSVPAVTNTVYDQVVVRNFGETSDDEILATTYRDTVRNLQAGASYYVRVAARTNNALLKYNYSPVMKISAN
jgi:hypothetical protein